MKATKLGRDLLLLLLTTRWYHMVASYGKVEFLAGKARAPSKRWARQASPPHPNSPPKYSKHQPRRPDAGPSLLHPESPPLAQVVVPVNQPGHLGQVPVGHVRGLAHSGWHGSVHGAALMRGAPLPSGECDKASLVPERWPTDMALPPPCPAPVGRVGGASCPQHHP